MKNIHIHLEVDGSRTGYKKSINWFWIWRNLLVEGAPLKINIGLKAEKILRWKSIHKLPEIPLWTQSIEEPANVG